MNRLCLILTPILISCCTHRLPSEYVNKTFELKNNIGSLSIFLPIDFDTSYTWTRYSDYHCGAQRLVRFANTNYSMLQETGYFSLEVPDSLYELTVSQPEYPECVCHDFVLDQSYIDNHLAARLMENTSARFEINELRTINQRVFAVFAETHAMKNMTNANLQATTVIDGQEIVLTFTCLRQDCSDFIKYMEESLNTIRITAGNKG